MQLQSVIERRVVSVNTTAVVSEVSKLNLTKFFEVFEV